MDKLLLIKKYIIFGAVRLLVLIILFCVIKYINLKYYMMPFAFIFAFYCIKCTYLITIETKYD